MFALNLCGAVSGNDSESLSRMHSFCVYKSSSSANIWVQRSKNGSVISFVGIRIERIEKKHDTIGVSRNAIYVLNRNIEYQKRQRGVRQ